MNTAKWGVRNNTWSSNELSILTNRSKNVSVSNGALHLTAQRERYTAYSETRDYTSGYLDTIRKASWTYGRFEMRAKLPTQKGISQGMWPAFWLRPNDGGDGEIDIMEAIGQSGSDNRVSQTLWYDYKGTKPRQAHEDVLPSGTSSRAATTSTPWSREGGDALVCRRPADLHPQHVHHTVDHGEAVREAVQHPPQPAGGWLVAGVAELLDGVPGDILDRLRAGLPALSSSLTDRPIAGRSPLTYP